MSKIKVTLDRWEGDEFIIVINGKPIGSTLTKGQGEIILRWLENRNLEDFV